MHSVPDKAEVTIDFPDKLYMGSFGRDCGYEVKAEDDGILIRLVSPGEQKRIVEIHLHHFLFANILDDIAASLAARQPIDDIHRKPLLEAARCFCVALEQTVPPRD